MNKVLFLQDNAKTKIIETILTTMQGKKHESIKSWCVKRPRGNSLTYLTSLYLFGNFPINKRIRITNEYSNPCSTIKGE